MVTPLKLYNTNYIIYQLYSFCMIFAALMLEDCNVRCALRSFCQQLGFYPQSRGGIALLLELVTQRCCMHWSPWLLRRCGPELGWQQ